MTPMVVSVETVALRELSRLPPNLCFLLPLHTPLRGKVARVAMQSARPLEARPRPVDGSVVLVEPRPRLVVVVVPERQRSLLHREAVVAVA